MAISFQLLSTYVRTASFSLLSSNAVHLPLSMSIRQGDAGFQGIMPSGRTLCFRSTWNQSGNYDPVIITVRLHCIFQLTAFGFSPFTRTSIRSMLGSKKSFFHLLRHFIFVRPGPALKLRPNLSCTPCRTSSQRYSKTHESAQNLLGVRNAQLPVDRVAPAFGCVLFVMGSALFVERKRGTKINQVIEYIIIALNDPDFHTVPVGQSCT
jgi:hypothetical protein